MTRRYYAMGRTASEAANDQEKARAQLIEDIGATPEQLRGARARMKVAGHDRAPDRVSMGRQGGEVSIASGEKVILEESHTNAHGERITTALRQNGPNIERFRIREVEAGPHSRLVSEHFGRKVNGR